MPDGPPGELRVTAAGKYRYPMPPELMHAICEAIIQHLKAYGVTEVRVTAEHIPPNESSD